jgi:hypothetical protein
VAVSANVSGLLPNTTYHFRIRATNPVGTSNGSDASFKTLVTAPVAVTAPATGIGEASASLHGTVNPEGEEAVSNCHFEYGTSESYGTSAPCTPNPGAGTSPVTVSAAVPGLTPATAYHFRLVATNSGGTSDGADAQFTTPAATLPEIGHCVALAKATGRYKTSACTTLSEGGNTGKYEWSPWPGQKSAFTGAVSIGGVTLETVRKLTIVKCTGGSLAGEYTGPASAAMTVKFTGCEGTKTLLGSCQSEGAAAGEVRWAPLEAHFGITKTATSSPAGWVFAPASGSTLASMTCGGKAATLSGSLIGPATPVNKMSGTFTLKFKGASGKQTPEKLEGGVKQTPLLELSSGNEVAGVTFEMLISNEEVLELKTNV